MTPLRVVLLTGVLVGAVGCGEAGAGDAKSDSVVMISGEDAEMNAAIAKAQATLDEFLSVAANPPAGAEGFKLKVRLEDENGVEHFWVTPFERDGDGFKGVLANDPEIVKKVTAGESIGFRRQQVTDWGYSLNGKQVGSFTVCVMLKRVPAEEAEQVRKEHGFQC